MAHITLKRTTDMPQDAQGRRIISGTYHNSNMAAIEGAVNGGLDNTNIAAGANIAGSKMADTSVPAAKLENEMELERIMYWVDL